MGLRPSVLRGLLAGVVAGAAASLVMDGFQMLVASRQDGFEAKKRLAEDRHPREEGQASGDENTTEKFARELSEKLGQPLDGSDKAKAGKAVHYAFGIATGALYGVSAEYLPVVRVGGGIAFGTLLFLTTDEWSLPKLDLATNPSETPAVDHLLHWSSHAVYGGTLEMSRRLLRGSM